MTDSRIPNIESIGAARRRMDPFLKAFTAAVIAQILGLFFSIALSSVAFAFACLLFLYLGVSGKAGVFRRSGLEVVFVPYLLSVLAMCIFAVYPGEAFSNSRRVLLMAVVFFIPAAFPGEKALGRFIVSIAAAAAFQSIGDIVVYYSQSFERLGYFQHYMTSAGMKMMALLIALPLVFRKEEAPAARAITAAAVVVILYALLLTQTRSSWLGFTGAAIFMGVVAHRSLLAAVPVLLLLFALLAPDSFQERAERMFSTAETDTTSVVRSNQSRVRMWKTGWSMFLDRPVFGVGDGDVGRIYRRYVPDAGRDEGGHLHSTYVHVLASHGIVGFLSVMLLFAALWRLMWRSFRAARGTLSSAAALGALAAFIAFLINGFAEYNFGDHEILVLLWTCAGIAVSAGRKRNAPGTTGDDVPAVEQGAIDSAPHFEPWLPLSVIIITRNEEHNIAACLDSVAGVGDIVIVDAASTDATVEIARARGARVFVEEWLGFAAAKTLALGHTRNEWVLWLDADERVTPELAEEIRSVLTSSPSAAAFRMARRAYFLGKWIRHCGWYPGYVTRLFRKSRARFNDALVHEELETEGEVVDLQHDLLHFTDRDLDHYFSKLNRYTTLAAQDMASAGKGASFADVILRPWAVFFKMYVLKAGFLDGRHGYLLCRLSASYVLAKYAKLWSVKSDRK